MRSAVILMFLMAHLAGGCGAQAPVLHITDGAGLQVSYLERPSSGPVVILLHGFPDDAHTWDSISAQLHAQGYCTVAPFLRGYPPTALPTMDTTIHQLGQDVIALLDVLGVQQAIVIGHDWGASAAYAAANLAPTRITKLITLAIAHPLALAIHPEVLGASPQFATFAQPGAPASFRANDFALIDSTDALWSPHWSFPADELSQLKAMFAMPGAIEAALGYYRATASGAPDPIVFSKTSVSALTIYGTADGAVSSVPFADQQVGFTVPVRVVPLPAGHFVHRERESEVVSQVLGFLQN